MAFFQRHEKLFLIIMFLWNLLYWGNMLLVSDIPQPSSPPVQTASIPLGPDNRYHVEDTTASPYEAIVYVDIFLNDGSFAICTGFVVQPDVVMTAAHCLKDASKVEIMPARDGQRAFFGWYTSNHFEVSQSNKDYGMIYLPKELPSEITPFELGEFPEHPALELTMVTAGYPGDKEREMWASEYQGFVTLKDSTIVSGGVSVGGQSGSPLFQVENGVPIARGILFAGSQCDQDPCEEATYFISFTDEVLAELQMMMS